jgi:hypothetical protein
MVTVFSQMITGIKKNEQVREHLLITTHMQQDLAADLLYKEIVNTVWLGGVGISGDSPCNNSHNG